MNGANHPFLGQRNKQTSLPSSHRMTEPLSPNKKEYIIYSFCHFDVKFFYVLIKIWKKEKHFTIILFCKQSKSEIKIKKFWFSKFDFVMKNRLL